MKHIYKHNFIKSKGGDDVYLAIRQRPSISYPTLQGSDEDIFEYKVEFTDEEINKAKKEHGIFLDDFEELDVKERKYYLRHRTERYLDGTRKYFKYSKVTELGRTGTREETVTVKTKFTDDEIEELKDKFGGLIDFFEKVRVK